MKERPPVTAKVRFQQRAAELSTLPLDRVFAEIQESNLWGAEESVSGLGSELEATAKLRAELPPLLRELGGDVMLDIPCGDFRWLSESALPVSRYIGGDIVEALVERNRAKYDREFLHLDLCSSDLPKADVVFCRDCLVHLSFSNIHRARQPETQRSTWLLTTTFLRRRERRYRQRRLAHAELHTRPVPMETAARVLVEGCTESGGGYSDKALGLWRIGDLP